MPVTLQVQGTCNESVRIHDFDRLTLQGLPGATLVGPTEDTTDGLLHSALTVDASRGVAIEGFTVRAGNGRGIAIRGGASGIQLRDTAVEGSVNVFERSQALVAGLSVRVVGGFGLFVGDMSDIHLEDSLFENTGSGWGFGIYVMSQLTVHNIIIRDFPTGMYVQAGGTVNIQDFGNFNPTGGPIEVLIENPVRASTASCLVAGYLNLGAKLRITNAGRASSRDSAAVRVENGGAMAAAANLDVSGSQGQGVFVTNNSSLSVAASTITGGLHGGLVVVNQSTATVTSSGAILSGNATDVFCDSSSLITGAMNIVGATTIQCANLRQGRYYESLP
jgi:hypothetical protein